VSPKFFGKLFYREWIKKNAYETCFPLQNSCNENKTFGKTY